MSLLPFSVMLAFCTCTCCCCCKERGEKSAGDQVAHPTITKKIVLRRIFMLTFAAMFVAALTCAAGSNCPGANPNDGVPDDEALQACLSQNPTLLLDPPGPSGPGYLLATGLDLVNDSFVSSSAAPRLAVLLAHPTLAWPMVTTSGTVVNITLSFLRIDGNRDARNITNAISCQPSPPNINYVTSNVLLPGYVFSSPPTWRCWDPWDRFVSNVTIVQCVVTHSPCGAAIGLSGRNIYVAHNQILDNGWDPLHNPQNVPFPYSDGLNCAVCTNATVEYNTFSDATNMVMVVGPGPYSLYQHNTITVSAVQSQNGINLWPTNKGEPASFWHPEPWTLAHSAVYNNTIRVQPSVRGDVGMFSGLAIGGLPWASYAYEDNAGLVLNNAVDSVNVGVLVDGVTGGTVFGNVVTNPYGGGSPANCPHPLSYTVADTNGTLLEPGFAAFAFRQGPCVPFSPPVVSAVDDAAFLAQSIDGVAVHANVSLAAGVSFRWQASFQNNGTSTWQGMVGGLGVKLGLVEVDTTPSPLTLGGFVWNANRVPLLLTDVVAPGQTYSFTATLVAPSSPGNYSLQWHMVHELIHWFGQATPQIVVEIL